jgi:glycosyltransferase involved in cell wall biosynthesis
MAASAAVDPRSPELRVLVVDVGSDRHGPANSLADLRYGLDAIGGAAVRVVWATGGTHAREGDVVLGQPHTVAGSSEPLPPSVRLRKNLVVLRALAREAKSLRPDVVHANTSSGAVVAALVAVRRSARASVHLREEALTPRRMAILWLLSLLVDVRLIAPSDRLCRALPAGRRPDRVRRRIRVVPNAVRGPVDRSRQRDSMRLRVVTVLTSRRRKAADVFRHVVVATRSCESLEWHVYGPRTAPDDGSWLASQLEQARDAVGDRLVLHERVDRLVDELVHFDVAFLPSRDESFGRVAVEAAAAGVIPVWARNVGFTSTLSPALDRFGFDIDDVPAAVRLILQLERQRDRLDTLQSPCRVVARRFAPDVVARSMLQVWRG